MSQTMEDHIFLEDYTRESVRKEYILDKKNSWLIHFDKDEKCFVCRNLFAEKNTKMKNVENLLKIWIYNLDTFDRDLHMSKMSLYIQGQLCSGFIGQITGPEKSIVNTLRFAATLKDII